METVLVDLIARLQRGERVALCVVVATRGSTPQGQGAKMLVTIAGQTVGTLGGGCVEAEARNLALQQLARDESRCLTFRLDQDYGWDDGMICGGVMDVLVEVLHGSENAAKYEAILAAVEADRGTWLELQYSTDRGPQVYREEIGPSPTLLIVGAGHVGQALARLAAAVGFAVDVLDDRADYATRERFPSVRHVIIAEIETRLAMQTIDDNSYVVIVTRGHRNDGRALARVVHSPARYIGLIGSRSKIKRIFAELHDQGVSYEVLAKVHAPIGLNIGSITVDEIALSIAAELVAVRHGKVEAVAPMRLPADEIQRWLTQK